MNILKLVTQIKDVMDWSYAISIFENVFNLVSVTEILFHVQFYIVNKWKQKVFKFCFQQISIVEDRTQTNIGHQVTMAPTTFIVVLSVFWIVFWRFCIFIYKFLKNRGFYFQLCTGRFSDQTIISWTL
jgi:hypothetical protein